MSMTRPGRQDAGYKLVGADHGGSLTEGGPSLIGTFTISAGRPPDHLGLFNVPAEQLPVRTGRDD